MESWKDLPLRLLLRVGHRRGQIPIFLGIISQVKRSNFQILPYDQWRMEYHEAKSLNHPKDLR